MIKLHGIENKIKTSKLVNFDLSENQELFCIARFSQDFDSHDPIKLTGNDKVFCNGIELKSEKSILDSLTLSIGGPVYSAKVSNSTVFEFEFVRADRVYRDEVTEITQGFTPTEK